MGRRNQLVNRCSRHRPSEDETLQSSRIPAEPVDKRTVNLYGVDRKTLQPVPKSSITNATPKLFSRCRVSSKWFTSFMNKLSVNSKQSPSGRRCAQGRRRRGQRHREQSFDAQKDSQQLTSRAQGVGDTLLPIARDPRLRIREIASLLDIPERAAQRIDSDLVKTGYIDSKRQGRRNVYSVRSDRPFNPPFQPDVDINALLGILSHVDDSESS